MFSYRFVSFSLLLLLSIPLFVSCNKDRSLAELVISIEEDKKIGLQVRNEIESKPTEYPILPESQYPAAYDHIRRITNNILNSGKVRYRNEFAWEVKIIQQDNVLNAFCTPGGYIYVYTGLIKYLDNEDQLAGVMGHEIAHADRRHSINQLAKNLGVKFVIDVALGKGTAAQVAQLAANFLALRFSRSDENDADRYSVIYLAGTPQHACDGAAYFFKKLKDQGNCNAFAWMSTHPDPCDRIENIENIANNELRCETAVANESITRYQDFKNSLP
jgi:predicted Zn-dependent protease